MSVTTLTKTKKATEQKAQAFLDALADYREHKDVRMLVQKNVRIDINRLECCSPLEYCLLRRNTWYMVFRYVGNIECEKLMVWVFNEETATVVQKVGRSMGLPIKHIERKADIVRWHYNIILQDGTVISDMAIFARKSGEAWGYASCID